MQKITQNEDSIDTISPRGKGIIIEPPPLEKKPMSKNFTDFNFQYNNLLQDQEHVPRKNSVFAQEINTGDSFQPVKMVQQDEPIQMKRRQTVNENMFAGKA